MLHKLAFSTLFNNSETKVVWLLVSVEASMAASVFPLVLHFLFMVAIFQGSFATCVQRKQSPHHSAWQIRSSEDQKPFLARNVL